MEAQDQHQRFIICSICSKAFTDPKILPCIHTFCLKCLESRARTIPGGNMLCPVCNKGFSIPKEGITKLQGNLFLERLVTLMGILNKNDRPCDACMEGAGESSLPMQSASARSYCCNCSMKLCDDCCKLHRRSKVTYSHKLVETTNQTITVQLMEMFAPSLCQQHTNEQLKLYCTDCKEFICALCYIEKHQGHRFSDIKLVAHQCRSQLRLSIDDISTCAKDIQSRQSQLEQGKIDLVKQIRSLKNEINKRRFKLRGLIDEHADSLKTELSSLEKEKFKDIMAKIEKIDQHNIRLENYKSYTSEFTEKAIDTDICQAIESVIARALELKELTDKIIQPHYTSFQAAFWKSNLEEFLSLDASNIIRTIRDDKYERSTKDGNTEEIKERLTKMTPSTRELETEKSDIQKYQEKVMNLSQKLDDERISKSSLQKLINELKQDLTRETAASRNYKQQIDKLQQQNLKSEERLRALIACDDAPCSEVSELEKTHREEKHKWMMKEISLWEKLTELQKNLSVATQTIVTVQSQLEDERNEKTILNFQTKKCLQHESDFIREKNEFSSQEKRLKELNQQLNCQKTEMSQAMNKLKQEVVSEQTICDSLKAEKLELQEKLKILQSELQSLRNVTLQFEDAEQNKSDRKRIRKLEKSLSDCQIVKTSEREKFKDRQTALEKLLFKGRPDSEVYKYARATMSFISSLSGKSITGLTVIGNTLYVTVEQSKVIESYKFDATKPLSESCLIQAFPVSGLSNPRDIKGSKRDCLYIFDQKSYDHANEIVIVDCNIKAIVKRWPVGANRGSLSITDEANILLTIHNKDKLKEYTSDGQLISEITLTPEVSSPLHSLKLTSGHFVVSYCRSTVIHSSDENGEVGPSSGICIVDKDGCVLRSFGEENESWLKDLHRPVCLAIDSSGSIIVADETSSRVLLLTSTLELKRELVSRWNGFRRSMKIHLDDSNGPHLFVVDDNQIHLVKFAPHPITMMQNFMEKTVKCLANILPRECDGHGYEAVPRLLHWQVHENFFRALQSQETLAPAFAVLAFLFFIVSGILFLHIMI